MEKKYIRVIFTESEKEEYRKEILKGLNEGMSYNEMASHLGISSSSVTFYRDELISMGKITLEEIKRARTERKENEKKQDKNRILVLEGLKEGKNNEEIGRNIDISGTRVRQIKKELIEEGIITQEEIDEAVNKREGSRQKLKEKVLELLNEEKTCMEIHKRTGYSYKIIREIKDELVAEGKVVFKRKGSIKIPDIEPYEEVSKELKDKVLILLKKGYPIPTIMKVLRLKSANTVQDIKKELIEEGKINEKDIELARNERDSRNKELVFKLLVQGFSQRQIVDQIEDSNLSYIQTLIKKLIKEGRITKEEIERYKFEQNEKEIREYMLRMLKQGYTLIEIIDMDDTGYLTNGKVKYYKDKLIAEGFITEKEIISAREKRKPMRDKQRKIDNVEQYDERILTLLNIGFSITDITKIVGVSRKYIENRKKVLILRKQLTQIRINNSRRDKEKNAEDRRNRIDKWVDSVGWKDDGKFDIEILKTHIEYCKGNFSLGVLDEKDIKTIVRGMCVAPELMTMGNINLVTTFYTRENRHDLAIKFINDCLVYIDDNNKRHKLANARDEINMNIRRKRNTNPGVIYKKGIPSIRIEKKIPKNQGVEK